MIYFLNNRGYIYLVIMLYHNTANYSWGCTSGKAKALGSKIEPLSQNILTPRVSLPRLLLRTRF